MVKQFDKTDHRIYTVGHSGRDFDEMLTMLRNNEITCLVDVRRFPSSRKFPQWNQAAIIDALPPGIKYRWIPELGGRRRTPKGAPSLNGAWQVKAFRAYADYMASDQFKQGLNELLGLAEHERLAIMCSEAVPWRCHRRLITDALIVAGAEVVHIMSPTTAKPAVLNKHAHAQDGHLTYPPPPDADMSIIEAVREAVAAIPSGSVASYGDIGNRIRVGPRQVGRVMRLLDDSVPWWRVVYADGTPASCHGGQAPELLHDEGTPMLGARVDMKRARQPSAP